MSHLSANPSPAWEAIAGIAKPDLELVESISVLSLDQRPPKCNVKQSSDLHCFNLKLKSAFVYKMDSDKISSARFAVM